MTMALQLLYVADQESGALQVRDGRVVLSKADGGGYMVKGVTDDESNRLCKNKERTQAIFGFDMDTWDDWCTRLRPEDCIMPHRPPAVLPGGELVAPPAGARFLANNSGPPEPSASLAAVPVVFQLMWHVPPVLPWPKIASECVANMFCTAES